MNKRQYLLVMLVVCVGVNMLLFMREFPITACFTFSFFILTLNVLAVTLRASDGKILLICALNCLIGGVCFRTGHIVQHLFIFRLGMVHAIAACSLLGAIREYRELFRDLLRNRASLKGSGAADKAAIQ